MSEELEQCISDTCEVAVLVNSFFNDVDKTNTWMNAKNMLLGGVSPMYMIQCGRTEKLINLIKSCLEGNTP